MGGTALAVVLGGAAFLLARERPGPAQIRTIVREATAPLEEMVAQLSRSLELSGGIWEDTPRAPSGLGQLLEQLAGAARNLQGADAAAVVVDRDAGEPLVATSGFAPGTRYDPALLRPAGARAVVVSYRHDEASSPNGEPIRAGLSVPLAAGGVLSVFWRDPARDPGETDLERLEGLAARAAPALERALAAAER